jgi:hypothetical protein
MVPGCCKTGRPEKQKVGRIAAANLRPVEMTAEPFWFSLYQTLAPRRLGVAHQSENEAPNWRMAPIREAFAPKPCKIISLSTPASAETGPKTGKQHLSLQRARYIKQTLCQICCYR